MERAAAAAGGLNGGGWDSLAEPLVLLAAAADGLMELAGEKWDDGGLLLYESGREPANERKLKKK